jgi:predicted MPP superfamily phosphohydrolase
MHRNHTEKIPKFLSLLRNRKIRLLLLLLLLAFLIAGFVIGRRLRVNYVQVPIGIPTPMRIAVLGDFHMSAAGLGVGMAKEAVQEALRQKPDVIILLGDYVSGQVGIKNVQPVFKGLHAPQGVYAVMGNHEYWTDADKVRKALEADGIRVLVNENVLLHKGKTQFALVGIDDLWAGKVDWSAAFKNVPKNTPILLASHNPDAALDPQGRRAALIVSGHTHGGQIAFLQPVIGTINRITGHGMPPATVYGRSHLYGLFKESWGWVYVTTGVSPGFAPPRWYLHPEVVVISLE